MSDTAEIMQDVSGLLGYRDELLARGLHPAEVMVMTGCALGVLICGGGR